MRRFGLLVALFLALGLVLLGAGSALWWQVTRGEDWDRAPDGLPVLRELERERVAFLRTQDWCQAYDDGSGVRANTLTATCTLKLDGGARVFDGASRARYEALAARAAGLPYDVLYVQIDYDGPRMTRARLALSRGWSREYLIYDPAYYRCEAVIGDWPEGTCTAVDDEWYHIRDDWN